MTVIELSDFLHFGPTSATLSKRSFATSVLSAEIPRADWSDAAPWQWGDEVAVLDNGQLVMLGHVTRCKPETGADGYYWDVEFSDYWARLENAVALTTFNADKLTSRWMVGANADTGEVPLTVSVSSLLTQVLNGAASLLPNGWTVDVSGPEPTWNWMTVPYSASGDTHASLLQQCLDWTPDLVSYFDYAAGGKLIVTDRADERLVILDPEVDDIESISLVPRHDLVPPVVGVLGVGMAGGTRAGVVAQYPEGVSLGAPYAQVATVDVPADEGDTGSSDVPSPGEYDLGWRLASRVTVIGRDIDTEDEDKMREWWIAKFPSLGPDFGADIKVGKSQLRPSTPDIDTSRYPNYSADAEYEFVEGELNGKTKTIKWGERIVESYITCKNPPAEFRNYFPRKYDDADTWQGVVRCKVRTINVHRRSWLLDADATEEPDDGEETSSVPPPEPELPSEDYRKLCYSVYMATRRLPYEGAVVLASRVDLNKVSGATLAIVNDRPELATMAAIIQAADYDIITGKTTLTCGPPEQVGIQDLINRIARIQGQQDRTRQDTSANDERGDVPSGVGWWDWDSQPRRADFPSISPWFELQPSSASQPLDADFSVRAVYGPDNTVQYVEVHQGWVYGPINKLRAGESEWNRINITDGTGDIYVNVELDGKQGKITSATIATYEAVSDEVTFAPGPFVPGRTGYHEVDYDVRQEFEGNPTTLSYHIASIKDGQVTHHALGAIVVSILPMQLIYEIDDYDADSTGTPLPESIVSVIDKREKRYALLRKIGADPNPTPIQITVPGQDTPIVIDMRTKVWEEAGVIRIGLEAGTFTPTPETSYAEPTTYPIQ